MNEIINDYETKNKYFANDFYLVVYLNHKSIK